MRVKAETQLNCKLSRAHRQKIEELAEKLGVTVSYLMGKARSRGVIPCSNKRIFIKKTNGKLPYGDCT